MGVTCCCITCTEPRQVLLIRHILQFQDFAPEAGANDVVAVAPRPVVWLTDAPDDVTIRLACGQQHMKHLRKPRLNCLKRTARTK